MNTIVFENCRNEKLLGYLKALGLLRVYAQQKDPFVRSAWQDGAFVLMTSATVDEVRHFFIENYSPTPIANPWNNSAGFDGKDDKPSRLVTRVLKTESERWQPYRRVLSWIRTGLADSGVREHLLESGQKDEFLRRLRSTCPEEFLPWIDAAVAINVDRVHFPALLGAGGNDGRLDFSVNFIARALDVLEAYEPAQSSALLSESLFGSAGAQLSADVAIGQFSPWNAGGTNATNGFESVSLVNPWDYLLLLEGTTMFAGALVKRSAIHDNAGARGAAFPFTFRSVGSGISTSSQEDSRGEVWLPVWDGFASFASVRAMFRKGRADIPGNENGRAREAAIASEAAAASITAGVSLGVRQFRRVGLAQRNGKSFVASTIGSVSSTAGCDDVMAILSRDAIAWVERVRAKMPGVSSVATCMRAVDDALFTYVNAPVPSRVVRAQELLIAIALLESTIARTQPEALSPLPYLPSRLIESLDDKTTEHAIASALSSLGFADARSRIRLQLSHLRPESKAGRPSALAYDRTLAPIENRHPARMLAELTCARAIEAKRHGDDWWRGCRAVDPHHVSRMLRFTERQMERTVSLLKAYALIEPARHAYEMSVSGEPVPIPADFAVMKLVSDHPNARDLRIFTLLASRQSGRAVDVALQRARAIPGVLGRWRDIRGATIADDHAYVAAMLVPIEPSRYLTLLQAAMSHATAPDAFTYVSQIFG